MKNEILATEQYILCGEKKLRCGFTTGSSATMASLASIKAIFEKKFPEYAKITTPKGWIAISEVLNGTFSSENKAKCSIKKDGGDDTDATNGILITSEVEINFNHQYKNLEIEIVGGNGIGKITKAGLDQKVGEFAINSVPRKMIKEVVEKVCKENNFYGKVKITISAENGEEIAKNTFNPYLGIVGGISILGTSGVVEPMSEEALIDSIFVEMRVISEEIKEKKIRPLIITPGNYGEDFLKTYPKLKDISVVRCSNFIGKAIDFAVELNFTHVFFVGHAGKFVKIAGGIMNTHSHNADCRMEIIASHTALTCFDTIDQSDIVRIFDCVTVDSAFDILDETSSTEKVCKSIVRSAEKHISRRCKNKFKFSFLMFSNEPNRNILATSRNWQQLQLEANC